MAEIDFNPAIRHLVERTTYGYNRETLELVSAVGPSAFLEAQLQPESLNDELLDRLLADYFPTLGYSGPQMVELLREPGGGVTAALELRFARLIRQCFSIRQLYELMVEFWTDHFSIFQGEAPLYSLKTIDEREVIRPHAMSSFRELLQASAKSPAMLIYLDNETSRVDAINENYARELLELHTLGVDGGYTEDDVVATARCFTGWTVQDEFAGFRYIPFWHDQNPKQVMGYYAPAGGGLEDGEKLLDYLASHPSTAAFISRKLCTFLVSDTPPQALVNEVTATYLQTGGDIRSMLRSIFYHPEFPGTGGLKFKRPQRYLAGCLRLLSATPSDNGWTFLHSVLSDLGHAPYSWPTPNGYPLQASYWLNGNAMLQRWNLASVIVQAPSSASGIDWSVARIEGIHNDELVQRACDILAYPLQENEKSAVTATLDAIFGNGPLRPATAESAARHIVYLFLANASFHMH